MRHRENITRYKTEERICLVDRATGTVVESYPVGMTRRTLKVLWLVIGILSTLGLITLALWV
jgi:hypothetical protein